MMVMILQVKLHPVAVAEYRIGNMVMGDIWWSNAKGSKFLLYKAGDFINVLNVFSFN